MSLGKRLRDIENVKFCKGQGYKGYSSFDVETIEGAELIIVHFRELNVFNAFDLKEELIINTDFDWPSLIILNASIIEGLDLRDASETLTRRPTFKIHYAALHKNLLAIHALYYGRIYTYDEKADAFHTWHLERIERGWSLLTMSEEIKPDWIVLDECDCYSRHLPGVYKIARFTDPVWWKGSAYEAKDQRRQDAHKAAHYKQQQREANKQSEYTHTHAKEWWQEQYKKWEGASRESGDSQQRSWRGTWSRREFEDWFNNNFKQRTHQQTYAPPSLDNKPGSILWAYSTLGLERGQCSFDDARQARKNLMKEYHPDVAGNDAAKLEKAQEINWAFDVLQGVLA